MDITGTMMVCCLLEKLTMWHCAKMGFTATGFSVGYFITHYVAIKTNGEASL